MEHWVSRCCFRKFSLTICVPDDGRISVHNGDTRGNGHLDVIDGSASVPDEDYPGELRVKFPGCG